MNEKSVSGRAMIVTNMIIIMLLCVMLQTIVGLLIDCKLENSSTEVNPHDVFWNALLVMFVSLCYQFSSSEKKWWFKALCKYSIV